VGQRICFAQSEEVSGVSTAVIFEKEKKQEGEILLVVQNLAPEQISLRSSRNEVLVFHLSDEAFRRGEFKYDLVVEAKKAGKVEVKGYVIPFLAPVAGQEFSVDAARRHVGSN
jgi:hypothetical protein